MQLRSGTTYQKTSRAQQRPPGQPVRSGSGAHPHQANRAPALPDHVLQAVNRLHTSELIWSEHRVVPYEGVGAPKYFPSNVLRPQPLVLSYPASVAFQYMAWLEDSRNQQLIGHSWHALLQDCLTLVRESEEARTDDGWLSLAVASANAIVDGANRALPRAYWQPFTPSGGVEQSDEVTRLPTFEPPPLQPSPIFEQAVVHSPLREDAEPVPPEVAKSRQRVPGMFAWPLAFLAPHDTAQALRPLSDYFVLEDGRWTFHPQPPVFTTPPTDAGTLAMGPYLKHLTEMLRVSPWLESAPRYFNGVQAHGLVLPNGFPAMPSTVTYPLSLILKVLSSMCHLMGEGPWKVCAQDAHCGPRLDACEAALVFVGHSQEISLQQHAGLLQVIEYIRAKLDDHDASTFRIPGPVRK